jgi:hypothetical protein
MCSDLIFLLNLTRNFQEWVGKGRAAGAAKHLEFSAGADQGEKAKTWGTVTARPLKYINMVVYKNIGYLSGRGAAQADSTSVLPLPLPSLCRILAYLWVKLSA